MSLGDPSASCHPEVADRDEESPEWLSAARSDGEMRGMNGATHTCVHGCKGWMPLSSARVMIHVAALHQVAPTRETCDNRLR
jgi:hypothetical protein